MRNGQMAGFFPLRGRDGVTGNPLQGGTEGSVLTGGGGETLVGTLRVQKGRWPVPLKNGFFLIYSSNNRKDIRDSLHREGRRRGLREAGPLRETPFKEGRSLREGPYGGGTVKKGRRRGLRGGTVLTGRAGVPYGSFTEKDDEEAYGMAGPYGEAPYEEGRSLREGPVPYGRAGLPYGSFTEKDDEEAYGKAGPLRKALTKRDGSFTEKDDEEAYAPYEEERSLREGPESEKLTGSYGERLYQNWAGISACVP